MKIIQFRIGKTDKRYQFPIVTDLGDLNNEVQLKERINELIKNHMTQNKIRGIATEVKLVWSMDLTKIQPD